MAQRISNTLRPYDHLGRYGGEEFLLVLTADADQVLEPFERIRHAVGDTPIAIDEQSLTVTLSCGVAMFAPPQYGLDANDMIGAADEALYQAKDAGRNRTVLAPSSSKIVRNALG